MKRILFLIVFTSCQAILAQIPNPALVGYFQNWNDVNSPYIQLDQIDNRYNVVNISFVVPKNGTTYDMEFIPDQVTQQVFISQIHTLQLQGRKVNISIGGANAPVTLNTLAERDTFVSSMNNIIDTFGFDGIDIDLEGASLSVSGGTITNPVDSTLINLIGAIRMIMVNYFNLHGKKLILTMAPETVFVQGGQSAYNGVWGAYLPFIDALRDSIDILHVQLYNSGTMYGIDGNIYTQGTADFIVAMTEATIVGFNTGGGHFAGLPADKIAIGLPACSAAAGGGYTDTTQLRNAIHYLRGTGPQPGTYVLNNPNGYPTLRGMMTWSVNWDAVSTCSPANEYAGLFESIFQSGTGIDESKLSLYKFYPNPALNEININLNSNSKSNIKIYNSIGLILYSNFHLSNEIKIDVSKFEAGIYFLSVNNTFQKFIIE